MPGCAARIGGVVDDLGLSALLEYVMSDVAVIACVVNVW
jgi:hypothetical protein